MANEEADLKSAFEHNNTSAMYKIIKSCIPLGSKTSNTTDRLRDKQGEVTNTYTESRAVVQDYVCTVFDGELFPVSRS